MFWLLYSAAMNIGVHVSCRAWFSLDRCPEVGLLDQMVICTQKKICNDGDMSKGDKKQEPTERVPKSQSGRI